MKIFPYCQVGENFLISEAGNLSRESYAFQSIQFIEKIMATFFDGLDFIV